MGREIRAVRKKPACSFLLLLCWLNALTPTAHPQTGKRKTPPAAHLYQVNTRDEKTGVKRTGFIDKTGRLVIGFDRLPKTTVAVGEFHEGRAVIYLRKEEGGESADYVDYTAGYIDDTGNVFVAPRFNLARDFSEGLAYVEAEGFCGFIDRDGKTVIKLDGLRAKDFHEGLAAVSTGDRGEQWGYINRSGKIVVKPQYPFADDFSEGLAGVESEGKYGFINRAGQLVIPPRFGLRKAYRHPILTVSSGRFSEGLACVSTGSFPFEAYGYINSRGDFVIPPRFQAAQDFSEGLAFVVSMDKVMSVVKGVGWIDKSGRWVVTGVNGYLSTNEFAKTFSDPNAALDWRYSEGLVPFVVYVNDRPRWGYMDRRGNVAIEPREFNQVGPFLGGLAWVEIKDMGMEQDYGYIDKNGRVIWRSKGVGRPQMPRPLKNLVRLRKAGPLCANSAEARPSPTPGQNVGSRRGSRITLKDSELIAVPEGVSTRI